METNKNKVLIFSLAYQPFIGGAEVAVKEITDRLGSPAIGGQGFCFEMITANMDGKQKKEEQLGTIKIYRLSLFPPPYEGGGWGEVKKLINKYLFPWLAYKKAVELHQKNNYQMIWAIMANQAGLAALFFKWKFSKVRYLLTLQEGDSERDIWLRTWFMRPLYKAIYRRADQIQTISNFLAARAKRLGAKCPIEVVPNGVSAVIARSEATKQSHGTKNIVTVSRLVKKNGIEDLIKAFNILVNSYQLPTANYQLVIIGAGNLREELESLSKNLKIEQQVKFLGEVKNEDVYKYLSEADVFVRPSLSEGLGNAFLEAMAMGVPVIGTKVGGIPDFLKDGETASAEAMAGKTGYFCEVKNPQSIAEKIKYILDEKNKDEVSRVAQNAKKVVEEKYNWDLISGNMKNIFNKTSE